MNHPLARALRSAGMNTVDVAARLGVDPKTVDRWMAGRKPYPRYRDALAHMTGWSPHDLWSDLPRSTAQANRPDEIRAIYPHRAALPADVLSRLFANADHEIGVLAYSALFLAEDMAVSDILCHKAKSGVRVRILLGKPDGARIAARGAEEGIGDGMGARIRTALVGFNAIVAAGGDLRLHDTVLYNSVYRSDDDLLVNTHIYGHPAAHAPVLQLRRESDEGMTRTYLDSFERVWATSHRFSG